MAKLIFDLDGTLIDSTSVFVPAIRSMLRHFPRIPEPTEEQIQNTFGLTDDELWDTLMPDATQEERSSAYSYRNKYVEENMRHAHLLLPHAFQVLEELHKRGHILTTASNCGTAYLNNVLDTQKIRQFFTNPLCLESVDGKEKADILRRHFQDITKENSFMIGDRASDIEAAHIVGIPAIGCQLGFGDTDELKNADFKISSLEELLTYFREGNKIYLPA
jgi:phosphoglycolate phosphatase